MLKVDNEKLYNYIENIENTANIDNIVIRSDSTETLDLIINLLKISAKKIEQL